MQIEEIVDLAAFPIMRRPMKRQGEEGQEDRVGPSAVQEFDPSLGEAGKPDWMRAEVSDPIKAILDTIVWKIAQIYRNATLSEAVAERKTGESGYALSIRRDLLNAALVAKAKYLAEAEERIAYFWCRWIGKDEWVKDIKIERPKRFSVEQLKLDLENAVLGKSVIHSETFSKELQKKLAREMMGTGIDDKKYSEIDEEIEVYEPLKVPEIEIEEE
jgi:aminopeptidase C